jgi:nucleoid-associated protein EbfC
MFNMSEMSKMLEGMQESAAKMQAELESQRFHVKSGGSLVELTLNGKGEAIDLNIDPSLLADKAKLEILLLGVMNDANKMLHQNQQNAAMSLFGGVK